MSSMITVLWLSFAASLCLNFWISIYRIGKGTRLPRSRSSTLYVFIGALIASLAVWGWLIAARQVHYKEFTDSTAIYYETVMYIASICASIIFGIWLSSLFARLIMKYGRKAKEE